MNEMEQRQDQDLVMFTDTLLESREEKDVGRPPLAETVEILARAVRPQAPPERLRLKIRKQIATEWARQQPSLAQRLFGWLGPSPRQPARQLAWAAVAIVAVVAVAAAVLLQPASQKLVGTVIGGAGMTMGAVLLVVVGVVVVGWYILRRK